MSTKTLFRISLPVISMLVFAFALHGQIPTLKEYHNLHENGIKTGGVRMITISTPSGNFKVWTKQVGNNPGIKVLLLHGGPGCSHEYLECFDSFFPQEGIEYYYYDQLGSFYSDKPNDTSLWHLDRFVDEVEQVRKALGLNKNNFYLFGHSWGGILALEYALKYQKNLKGLIISNMMCSIPEYNKYAVNVLAKQLPPDVLAEIEKYENNKDYGNPEYTALLEKYFYPEHLMRLKEYPEPASRGYNNCNVTVYTLMQGPSEFKGSGRLINWDRSKDLPRIVVPTLIIGAKYDTMDPRYMKWMSTQVQNGSYLYCPNGSHSAMYDDQEVYFAGLIDFIKKVNSLSER
jgi:proline iminopeptidase